MYYEKHKNSRGFLKRRLFIAVFSVLLLLVLTEVQIRPMMMVVVENEARTFFTDSVSLTVSQVMGEEDIDYSDLVTIVSDSQGNIASVQVNTSRVNLLSAEISERLSKQLSDGNNVGIPIDYGTLTGIRLFGGCGPNVRLRLKLEGSVRINIEESFVEKGINQTLHTVNCTVTASVTAYIPGLSKRIEIKTQVPIANTVIVGEVPQSYTYVNGDKSDTIGRIFDYGDPYGSDVFND